MPRRFLPDTNCMIAATCAWHEHHERAANEIRRRLADGEVMVIAAPAVVEMYAVLTRFPPPHRISPIDALTFLDANYLTTDRELTALTAIEYRELVRAGPPRAIAGGRVYDAVIVACAEAARVNTLLTFNVDQFQGLVNPSTEVVLP